MGSRWGAWVVLALAVGAVAGCGGGSSSSPSTTTSGAATSTTAPSATTAATTTNAQAGIAPGSAAANSNAAPKVSVGIAAVVPASPAELARGRALFQSSTSPAGCGFCHTLRAAETTSPVGPDLDAEVTETDLRRFTGAQLAQRVLDWIQGPECLSATDPTRCMPANLYTGAQADAIAAFVATCGRAPQAPGCKPVAGGLQGEALTGEHLYQSRGCVGCHFSVTAGAPAVGPSLVGLAGSKVLLADGSTVVANNGYLVASIATPDGQIVKGYTSGMMSARVAPQHLTAAQIEALVAYIETLK